MAKLITLDNGSGTLTVQADRIEAVVVQVNAGWVRVQMVGNPTPHHMHFPTTRLLRTNTARLFAEWGKAKV